MQNITVSGSQIWKQQILTKSNELFAFASTLAVYVFDKSSFQLLKLLTFDDTNFTAIAFEPSMDDSGLGASSIAQATIDKKLVIWDLEQEMIKLQIQLFSHVKQIEWSACDSNSMFILQSNHDLKMIDLQRKEAIGIDLKVTESYPTIVKFHPKRKGIVAVGLRNGKIFFMNLRNQDTYLFDACQIEDRVNQQAKNMQQTLTEELGIEDIREDIQIDENEVCIKDLQWDPFEDNLLVLFGDNSMSLVTFQGLDSQTFIAKKFQNSDRDEIDQILWLFDRSGNFITSNKKIGVIQLWNVALDMPKKSFKVGVKGIHNMIMLDDQYSPSAAKENKTRILFSMMNGAVSIFDLQK